jgi:hypothetical protein
MDGLKYSVDSRNRLAIKSKQKKLVADGRFSVDSRNRLVYWLNEPPAWRKKYELPPKISFQGNWRLNKNYDLELDLDKPDGKLSLKGEIISTDRDALVFKIASYDKNGQAHIQILTLSGSWQADAYNRLSFTIKKSPSPDTLTLGGAWQVNQNQQIVYTYKKTGLKTKTKSLRELKFEGFWNIDSANKLVYILEHSAESRFDFRAQLESPNLYPKEGVIKYRIGIGLKGLPPKGAVPKIIALYGAWKFSRKFGLNFEMDYGRGKINSIEFGANVNLSKKDAVVFSLTDKRGEPLGVNVNFSHRFLKKLDAEALIRLKKFGKEGMAEGSLRIPF